VSLHHGLGAAGPLTQAARVPPPVHDRPVADERQQESTGIRTGHPTRTSRGVFTLNRTVASANQYQPGRSALSTTAQRDKSRTPPAPPIGPTSRTTSDSRPPIRQRHRNTVIYAAAFRTARPTLGPWAESSWGAPCCFCSLRSAPVSRRHLESGAADSDAPATNHAGASGLG
jgi:hypothetical protein